MKRCLAHPPFNPSLETGSVSAAVLFLLLFLSAVAGGAHLFVRTSLDREMRYVARYTEKQAFLDQARFVAQSILSDKTPEGDSKFDAVWRTVAEEDDSTEKVILMDVSSAFNPNWLRKGIFDGTELGSFLKSGVTLEELQASRFRDGISADVVRRYADFLDFEKIEIPTSGFSYFNINITDEFVLERVAAERTGDPQFAEIFRRRIQEKLIRRELFVDADMPDALTPYYEDLNPLINTRSVWNVNFLDADLLEMILSYDSFGIRDAEAKTREIVAVRNTRELIPQDIVDILEVDDDNRVLQYLGTKTWMWRISVTGESMTGSCIFAVYPQTESLPREVGERGSIIEATYERH